MTRRGDAAAWVRESAGFVGRSCGFWKGDVEVTRIVVVVLGTALTGKTPDSLGVLTFLQDLEHRSSMPKAILNSPPIFFLESPWAMTLTTSSLMVADSAESYDIIILTVVALLRSGHCHQFHPQLRILYDLSCLRNHSAVQAPSYHKQPSHLIKSSA
ncbi:hypothetical protein JAAARDRAFT_405114 [Jaapia argillacea MUCL 33604]|uniref:Uncharacterized protein n=1 Tax=Jaapia argillacea MUCL 33604 TaxID=933084 RepID=A0A067PHN2_9AGAM|nr:hypothetical protein JAAARDRAFT_405114 [Jaapia argillacea MUCL 33604]